MSYKSDFPVLQNGICFLDSGASAQKPQCVLDTQDYFSTKVYANVHRGTYDMSQEITTAYENARTQVADFINGQACEIVFTKSVTESMNLVAHSLGRILSSGANIVISEMEHHANIVPWYLLADIHDITIRVCPIHDNGMLDYDALGLLVDENTALVAITHTSNVLGTVVDIPRVVKIAKSKDALVLVDGAQAVMHRPVDVNALGVDFYAFTGHKMFAPNGVGVLWGRYDILDKMPPYMGGGDMIDTVDFSGITYAKPPVKFEAGTPPIVPVICLGRAVQYVQEIGFQAIQAHEHTLNMYLHKQVLHVKGVRILGLESWDDAYIADKAPVVSFVVEGVHAFDIADILNQYQVCVRVGNHCAQPLMKRFGVSSTIRASLSLYNDRDDIDRFTVALGKAITMLRG